MERLFPSVRVYAAGVALCASVAMASFASWLVYKPVSSLMWSFLYSILITNVVDIPGLFEPGLSFCAKRLLRGLSRL